MVRRKVIIKRLERVNAILQVKTRQELAVLCPYAREQLENFPECFYTIITACASYETDKLLKDIRKNGS